MLNIMKKEAKLLQMQDVQAQLPLRQNMAGRGTDIVLGGI